MEYIDFFKNLLKIYWGNYGIQVLFYLALIVIVIFERNKIKKVNWVWYTVSMLIIIFNPVMVFLCKKLFGDEKIYAYYSRLFCVIPIFFVIAYGLVLILANLSGWRKVYFTICMLLIIAVSGVCVYGEKWFVKANNFNKVPVDVMQINDMFLESDDVVSIMVPVDLAVYLRQIDSKYALPFGRYGQSTISYKLESDTPDVDTVIKYAMEHDVDFIVCKNIGDVINFYQRAGCKLYGLTEQYAVFMMPKWILTQYAESSYKRGMFYTIQNTDDGTLIVIDGGWEANEDYVRKIIDQKGGIVDTWILTNYNADHIGAFNKICENPQGIEIKKIYDVFIDSEIYHEIAREGTDDIECYEEYNEVTEDLDIVYHAKASQKLQYEDMIITFLNVFDDNMLKQNNILDNASLVFKIETNDDSVLFCSDCNSEYIANYLMEQYKYDLKAKYVQVGYHGYNSLPEDFYNFIEPEYAFFDAPDWMMSGERLSTQDLADFFKKKNVVIYDYTTAPNIFGLY